MTSNKLVLYTKISKGPAGFWNHKRASKIFGAVWERNLRSRSLLSVVLTVTFSGRKEGGDLAIAVDHVLVDQWCWPSLQCCGATVPISGNRQCQSECRNRHYCAVYQSCTHRDQLVYHTRHRCVKCLFGHVVLICLLMNAVSVCLPVETCSIRVPMETCSVNVSVEVHSVSVPIQARSVSVPVETSSVGVPIKIHTVSVSVGARGVSVPTEARSVSMPIEARSVSVPTEIGSVSIPSKVRS